MWLLAAELRKLVRPLVWGTMAAAAGFCVLLAWGATSNAAASAAEPRVPSVCQQLQAPPACQAEVAGANSGARAEARATSRLERPGAVGQVAAGMLASLPGVFVLALLAGGHWGGEWSGRTVRTLFAREGRRGRVLAAKWASLWLAGVAIMAACWAALAVAGPLLAAAYGLPPAGVPLWHGFGASIAVAGHALVVLAFFSAAGVAAGTVARAQLGTTAVTAGVLVVTLILAGLSTIGRWSPAAFVQGWMRFRFSGDFLPTNFWARFVGKGGDVTMPFTEPAALAGLVLCLAVAAVIARRRIAADVKV
jgi:ABC-type transport system involved in multi-copper enzyme maturation permease subunit